MKKRIIAWALTLCLVLLPVPVTALAEEVPDFTGYYEVVSEVMDEVGFTNLKDYGKDWNRGLLWDLDGDGTKELLLNTYNGKNYRAEGFQLWTLREGKPVLLLKGNPYTMSLYTYYLAEYQGEDFFVLHHSDGGSGASTDYYHFYKIGDPSDGEYKEIFYVTDFYLYGGSHTYEINNIEANKEAFDKLADAVKNGTELKVEAEGTRLDDILESAPAVEPGGLWFQQYGAYIKKHYESAEYKDDWHYVAYYLLYIDEDDIPELWIVGQGAPFENILLSCQDGELVELVVDASHVVYEERSGIFYLPLHRMGWGQDQVYTLSDGTFTLAAKGTEEAKLDGKGQMVVGSDGYVVLNYFWEGTPISKADYQAKLDGYVDPDQAIESYPDVDAYDYWGMGQFFAHMADSLHSGSCGENATWTLTADGTLTISGTDTMDTFQSPGSSGYAPAPWMDYSVTSVVIENGITNIGCGAFLRCDSLTSVTIPNSVTRIEAYAFSGCTGLANISIPDSVTTIGNTAFHGCTSLTSVTIPDGVIKIEGSAFSSCTNLTNVTIADSVTHLNGFSYCTGLTSITIPNSVTHLKGFDYCTGLTSITIPDSVTIIEAIAFNGCTGLTSVIIPDSVTEIGSSAFADCTGLSSITIPGSVTTIGQAAFARCTNLKEITFAGDCPLVIDFDAFEKITATCYYPADNATWTENKFQNYNGDITWVSYDANNEPTEPEEETPRIAGGNRFETANLVADQMKKNLGIEKFDAVVVASGTDFADALAGSYLAAVKNAPILLAYNDKINEGVKDYIKANLNQGGTVYILGGTKAVPESFKDGLEDTFTVKRLAGNNRFLTNLLVLEEAGVGDKPVLVATGLTFADSLSASAAKLPILLVYGDKLLPEQEAFLNAHPGRALYVIGGEGAVSGRMEEVLQGFGTVERVAGGNRFETSVLIAEKFFENPESAVLAYAWDFPDGLCGGPLATTMNAPLILTMAKYEAKAAEYVQGKGIDKAVILGGEKLIPQTSIDTIFPRDTLHENELPIG